MKRLLFPSPTSSILTRSLFNNKQIASSSFLFSSSASSTRFFSSSFSANTSGQQQQVPQQINETTTPSTSTLNSASSSSLTPRGRLFFITLAKSPIHQTEDIKAAIRALKLKKPHQVQVHKDTPQVRGLIYKCRLLLSVKSVSTAELFPEGTQHLPQHVRLTMEERRALKIKSMREKKSLKLLTEEYIAEKKASSQ
ncbi:hypothetical protein C9374_012261 [Naegleria lovaniensis]|uniref:Large ribosomal subunit protein uL30m n=1 Tax=Naegleria lovaniensis TaxID=51637 RepID=A0AA88GCW5_NAELO|nr:uncharacterized protein C9374_012261 [Naegleria lovaniensis]KAG2373272.1 hypothetical protein C9374_012261 [Naegleria lovaniensis]